EGYVALCYSPRWRSGSDLTPPEPASDYLENALHLNGDVPRQRAHPDGAARPDTGIVAEHFGHQLRETVDHLRLILEVRRGIDHAQRLHQALDAVECTERIAHC